MNFPFPAFALTHDASNRLRVVRVRVTEIIDWPGEKLACMREVDGNGYPLERGHMLPLSRVASTKTLAAKLAAFSASESRPPLSSSGSETSPLHGMTDSEAVNSQYKPTSLYHLLHS